MPDFLNVERLTELSWPVTIYRRAAYIQFPFNLNEMCRMPKLNLSCIPSWLMIGFGIFLIDRTDTRST